MEVKLHGDANPSLHKEEFWQFLDELVSEHRIVIDRPKGSRHPRYADMIYPFDYGYLEGTRSQDGDGIDIWIGPGGILAAQAVLLTIDHSKKDLEIKIVVGCNDDELLVILKFLNDHSMRATLIKRKWDERDLLRSRHSIRRFRQQAVPRAIIDQILEATTWAPSAHNRQPWRVAVLTNAQKKAELAEAMGKEFQRDLARDGLDPGSIQDQIKRSSDRITQAPVCLVLCLDTQAGDHYPDPKRSLAEHIMGVQSVAMAGQNLMLAATAYGLGSVWMCAPLFAPESVRQALDLPSEWLPQGLVLLGYPAREPVLRTRKPVDEIARFFL